MGEPFTVQARCGAVLGSVSVQCRSESTVDEVIERMLRCQGASTSAPDVVSLSIHQYCLHNSLITSTSSFNVYYSVADAVLCPVLLNLPLCVQSVTYRGRPCGAQSTLTDLGIVSGSSLDIALRLRGGGGDGGATGAESRISYLEMYASKKPDKVRLQRLLRPFVSCSRWLRCS